MKRMSGRSSIAAWLIGLTICCGIRGAEVADAADISKPMAETIEVEVYKSPVLKELRGGEYPQSAQHDGYEGWVSLNFMVDPQGKAYEISVMDSLGGAPFEKSAIRAIERSTFEPAKLGSTAVDAGDQLKIVFSLREQEKGANNDFVAYYRRLLPKIEAGDKDKADALLADLKARNLYEEAFRNYALYQYYKKWGTEDQQLFALRNAVAREETSRYLGKEGFTTALHATLTIEVKRQDFGEALETWRRLAPVAPKSLADAWKPVMTKITDLQASHVPVRLVGEIARDRSWFNRLFRRRFEVVVLSGQVAEIKLRCDKRYVFFRYEPGVQYTVGKRDGECSVELVGDHGTKFELVQT